MVAMKSKPIEDDGPKYKKPSESTIYGRNS